MKGDLGPADEPAMAPLSQELQDYFDQLLQGLAPEPATPVAGSGPEMVAATERRPNAAVEESAEPGWAEPPPERGAIARGASLELAPLPPYAEPLRHLPRPLPPLAPAAAPSEAAGKIVPASPDRQSLTALKRSTATRIVTNTRAETATEAPAEAATEVRETTTEAPLPEMPAKASQAAVSGPQPISARPTGAFEVLLFRVGGLSLAVPLTALGVIRPLDQPPTPLFGQAPWYIGVVAEKQGTARVVDTAQLVMPERYCAGMREAYRYIIALHGSEWALAVDEIVGTVKLQPREVRWRSRGGKRPWLAGTVVEHMCALLDAEGLEHALRQPASEQA